MATTAVQINDRVRFFSTNLNPAQWVTGIVYYVNGTGDKFMVEVRVANERHREWLRRDDTDRYTIMGLPDVPAVRPSLISETVGSSVIPEIDPVFWRCSHNAQKIYFIIVNSNHLHLLDIESKQYEYFVTVPAILPSGLIATSAQSQSQPAIHVNSIQLDAECDLLYLSVTQTFEDKQRAHALLCLFLDLKQLQALKTTPQEDAHELHPNTYVVADGTVHTLDTVEDATYCYVASLQSMFRFDVNSDSDGSGVAVFECSVRHELDQYVWQRLDLSASPSASSNSECVECTSILLIYEHIAVLFLEPKNLSPITRHIGASICFVDLKYKQMYMSPRVLPRSFAFDYWACDEANGMVHGFEEEPPILKHCKFALNEIIPDMKHCKFALKEIIPDELRMFYRHKVCEALIVGYMKEKERAYKVQIPMDVKRIVWQFYPLQCLKLREYSRVHSALFE